VNVMGDAKGLMSQVPLNVRMFMRNALRGEEDVGSLMNPEDLNRDEVDEIYKRIDEQEQLNTSKEAFLRKLVPDLKRHLTEYPETPWGRKHIQAGLGTALPPSVMDEHHAAVAGHGGLSDSERYEENLDRFNAKIQGQIDEALRGIKSYEDTRGRTSVTFDQDTPAGGPGPSFIETIRESFASPAYNISSTLRRFKAFKNEDGTVTIKDTYNWTGQDDDPEDHGIDVSLGDFLRALPIMINHPEAFGNVLMRTLLKHKTSPIEFTLPPRSEDLPTEMAKGYREGGRVRLI
jgi:hypothetical protein